MVIDVPLFALLDGLDQSHPHNFNSPFGFGTDCYDSLVDRLEL